MKKIYVFLLIITTLSTCKSTKNASQRNKRNTTKTTRVKTIKTTIPKQAEAIITEAKRYRGTKYKYGGTTKKGMDCSGLIFTSFGKHGITMPRTTKELSTRGNWVDIKKIQEGDLVFFATKKNSRKVNHVGIVTAIKGDDVSFIHSSSSRGVMISKLLERYWYFAYVQARRYL
ncbi:MAG: C40 family peptidase [Winogradskyella sp.]|uniref:C40 family peptidase n=1 Tax=Winogradskyella sp. TaxID=1883156 RepID=UPI0017FF23B5|nr:C40 family peptidase [Winogradskyella sp.]MBT8245587.1 C40 family peptidase [Winogradskyella sp.]NNK22857.1 C40 family peptidase [Winogradskyella sp.]